ncbi:MAG: glutamate-1-semialdehyde 2,1-aminomutase [Sphingobacteriales bacterium]|jgi:glutamate-1-semialdehyde 2,1-aminomutase
MSTSTKQTNTLKSEALFEQAQKLFPGGVNSPVRAFGSVGGTPRFMAKGEGCKVWDVDGNEFIDFCGSWGPLILGHCAPSVKKAVSDVLEKGTSFGAPTSEENELGELILNALPHVDKVRFVNSGTEAVMSALRVARGFTGKNKVIKFEGCYHGHVDSMLVKAGSGLATMGTSSSAGVPEAFAGETIVLPLGDKSLVEDAFAKYKDDIACIIIEPVPANNGLLLQDLDFLQFLRDICTAEKSLLFFDEVISGFRIAFGGAAEYYGITPDIVSYGKIIGGGLPVGAYGGKAEIMDIISPLGPVYQAGTLSGNPLAMAAGVAQIKECLEVDFYKHLEQKTKTYVAGLNALLEKHNVDATFIHIGSIFWMRPGKNRIISADQIDGGMMDFFNRLFHALLEHGIYVGPSGYEVGFISKAHTPEILEDCLVRFEKALVQIG